MLRGLLLALELEVAGLMRGRWEVLQRVVEAGGSVEWEAVGGSLAAQVGACVRCCAGQQEEDRAEEGEAEDQGVEGVLAGGVGGEKGAEGGGSELCIHCQDVFEVRWVCNRSGKKIQVEAQGGEWLEVATSLKVLLSFTHPLTNPLRCFLLWI
ncbi:unnamed protein product [Closterium sp. NIES-54]